MKNFFLLAAITFLLSSAGHAVELEILALTGTSTVPENVYPGDVVTLTMDIRNISASGNNAVDVNAFVELNEGYFEPIKLSESLGSISATASQTVSLRFRVKEGVLPGNYKIPVFLSYTSGYSSTTQSDEINLGVSSCKILKIDDISLTSSSPRIGSDLGVSAKVKNVCSTAARDVTVSLRPVTNTTIAPFVVPEGTVKKIGDILPDSESPVAFSLNLSDNVLAQTYVFALDANCEGCTSVFSNSFSFQAKGTPELVFSNIEYSVENAPGNDKTIMQGSEITLSVQLDNIGEEKAKAVEVSVDFAGNISGSSKSFLGNIDPDDSGAAIFNLSVPANAATGEQKGSVTVSYIDEAGGREQFEEDYSLFVREQPPVSPVVYIIILALIIAVLGIIYFIIRFIFRQLAIRKSQSR